MSDDEIFYDLEDEEKKNGHPNQDAPHLSFHPGSVIKLHPINSEEILVDLENSHNITTEPFNDTEEKEDKLSEQIRQKIMNLKYESMMEDLIDLNINLEFFKKNMPIIPVKNKNIKEMHFENLFVLQDFQCDSQAVWIAKFSYDGKYLATGGQSGVLKIWSVYSEDESLDNYEYKGILSYIKLINENAYRVFNEHVSDIVDLSWNMAHHNLLLTASLDKYVILWDVEKVNYIGKFQHSAFVASVCFSPKSDELLFVTACLDKIVRIWCPKKNKVIDYINLQDYITAVAYFPNGESIIVGSVNGKASVYECKNKIKYSYSFHLKNKKGGYSDGTKITNLEFLNNNTILATTNDSSIRLVNACDGKSLQKFKGLINEKSILRAFFEEIYDLVICSSDDGYVYVWKKIISSDSGVVKNRAYEYFKSFEKENSVCSFFANDHVYRNYINKIVRLTPKLFLKSILINLSDTGRLQILINIEPE